MSRADMIEIDRLRKQVRMLRRAAKPFAKIVRSSMFGKDDEAYPEREGYTAMIALDHKTEFTGRDIERLREALRATKD